MKHSTFRLLPSLRGAGGSLVVCVLAAIWPGTVPAAVTEVSNLPIASSGSSAAKPNIMVLMDTSVSMRFTHAPDQLEGTTTPPPAAQPIGYRANQCNSLYYNPSTVYKLPKDSTGATLPMPSFNNARYNYYSTDADTVDLREDFRAFDRRTRARTSSDANDDHQRAYYYVFTPTSGPTPATLPYNAAPCTDAYDTDSKNHYGSHATTGGTWRRVLVGDPAHVDGTSGVDERQNFAIWYVYYRTRIALSKSSMGLAFSSLSDQFRVGFITGNPLTRASMGDAPAVGASVDSTYYLPLADFNATQKNDWFNKLYSQPTGGTSPMREGLARVGRHYANQHDSINIGMPEDPNPLGLSCQQNYTIMTTDGYWNRQAETRGPVKLDGTTLVGQQDGTLTDDSGNTPRPIWDGGTTGSVVTTDKLNTYSTAACVTGLVTRNTTQHRASTTQITRSTSQPTQSTAQINQSTAQISKSTSQVTASTSQLQKTVTQITASTLALTKSTSQLTKSTTQLTTSTTTPTTWTEQLNISTSAQTISTSQTTRSTSQLQRSTLQNLLTTTAITKSTSQLTKSTSQLQISTLQNRMSTSQTNRVTTQLRESRAQSTRSTSQWWQYVSESWTPVAGCGGASPTCSLSTTGPTQVVPGSCVAEAANAGNDYVTTTCNNTNTGPTPVAACTPQTASSANGYLEITCDSVTTGPTPIAAASCTPAAASSTNSYTTTTCPVTNTGPTPVASCTASGAAAGNSYTTTTCSTATTGPTGVASCTAVPADATNSYTATYCNTATTGPTGVASCTNDPASAGNSYVATTCNTATTGPTAVASCTGAAAAAGNSYTATTCSTSTNGPDPVASCTPAAAAAGNGYVATTCSTNTTGPTGVATCTNDAASAGNSWTATTCNTVTTGPTGVSSCTAASADAGNSYTTTTCATVTTGPTGTASCTPAAAASGNSWTTTSCTNATTGPTPTGSCTAQAASSGNGWVATNCNTVTSSVTNVASCTPVAADAGNNWTATKCGTYTSPGNGTSSCTPSPTETCTTVTTGPTPTGSCTAEPANAGNNWTETTCNTVTTGPTPVASCTNTAAAAGNSWTATSCSSSATGPTPVASCTPAAAAAGNGYVKTDCATNVTGPTGVDTCFAESPTSGNDYKTVACNTVTTGPTGVASCTPQTGDATNSWLTRNCNTVTTGPTLVASCTPAAAAAGNSYIATTCSTATTGPTPVASCTPVAAAAGNSYVSTTCSTSATGPTPVASCTPVAAEAGNSYTATTCNTATTGPTPVASCTPATGDAGNSYVTTTCNTVNTGPTPVASCTPDPTPNAGNSYTVKTCDTVTTGPDVVATASCTASAANATNSYTATTCVEVPGEKIRYFTKTTVSTQTVSGGVNVGPPVVTTSNSGTVDLDGVCYPPSGGTPARPALFPAPAARPVPVTTASESSNPAPVSPCVAWPCVENVGSVSGGSSDSLADVAQYYYVTDLRPDLMDGVLVGSGTGPEDDRLRSQHMTTYVVGLGVNGTLNFDKNYLSGAGDFASLRSGALGWPVWPTAAATTEAQLSDPKSIDDFWHAAVNGRGKYFSARDAESMVSGIQGALNAIGAHAAAGGGATTSTATPTAGDNTVFIPGFKLNAWTGDLQAHSFDVGTAAISGTVDWSARTVLDTQVAANSDTRRIVVRTATGEADGALSTGDKLTSFLYGNLNATRRAYFDAAVILDPATGLNQGVDMSAAQIAAAPGSNLVNYLRGQKGLEDYQSGDVNRLYRRRENALGDIVGSQPVYVKEPSFNYSEASNPGYAAFKSGTAASRKKMVYVGANDGMLHAFYAPKSADANWADRGKEAWAYIPSQVLPNLYKLADVQYSSHHQFYVDGTVTVADVQDASSNWHTILVGGLNAGGKGYYALDITIPDEPKSLWEFTTATDANMGLSMGRPIISKLTSGEWVVMFTSGYNNADGVGYLYVRNAMTGALVKTMSTGEGTAGSPSGLREINNWVSNVVVDNTTQRVYGGDLLGNVWRFEVNDAGATSALKLATLTTGGGTPTAQPITTRVELAEIGGDPYVFVGTGRLLGESDLSNTQLQSVYSFKDINATYASGNVRTSLKPMTFVDHIPTIASGPNAGQPDLANGTRTLTCTGSAAQCAKKTGWVIDLPDTGERMTIDFKAGKGTLVFVTSVPAENPCGNGYSWLNYVDMVSGEQIAGAPNTGVILDATSMAVGLSLVDLTGSLKAIGVSANGSVAVHNIPWGSPPPVGKRISWREVAQ